MPYDLNDFCGDVRSVLTARGLAGLPELADHLSELCRNPSFVAATFDESTPPGQRELAHDRETGAFVLAHVQPPIPKGTPHSHGDSWAIYGTVRGASDMTEWRRVDDGVATGTAITVAERYTLAPGQTRAYHSGAIHSTAHPTLTWVIRVTGTNLDTIDRYRFDPKRDRIVPST